jgi:hypothetical protein
LRPTARPTLSRSSITRRYEHMLAGNQMIRGIVRAIVGAEPFRDYPV